MPVTHPNLQHRNWNYMCYVKPVGGIGDIAHLFVFHGKEMPKEPDAAKDHQPGEEDLAQAGEEVIPNYLGLVGLPTCHDCLIAQFDPMHAEQQCGNGQDKIDRPRALHLLLKFLASITNGPETEKDSVIQQYRWRWQDTRGNVRADHGRVKHEAQRTLANLWQQGKWYQPEPG